jgi:gluconate 5-dehydrogenase
MTSRVDARKIMTAHKEVVLDRLVSYFDEEAEFSKQTEETFGDIDILVNNSGATWGAPAEEMPLEKFDLVMRLTCGGRFLCLRPWEGV